LGDRRLVLGLGKVAVAGGQSHLDPLDFADQPVANDFRRLEKIRLRPLPRARLPDAPVLLNSPHNRLLLGNGARQRFLAVNVLAAPRRFHRNERVPVIRQRQHHRVNVRPRQQLPVIVIRGAIVVPVMLVDALDHFLQVPPIHVARRNHLTIRLFEKRLRVAAPHPTASDDAHDNAVGRRRTAAPAQRARWNDRRRSQRHARDCQKPTT